MRPAAEGVSVACPLPGHDPNQEVMKARYKLLKKRIRRTAK